MKYEVRLHPDWPHTNVAYVFSDGKEVATFYGGGRTPDEVKRLATEAAAGMNRREDAQSLRDHFAGMAMGSYLVDTSEGSLLDPHWVNPNNDDKRTLSQDIARRAYAFADAMLAERANQPAQFLGSPNAVKSEIERDLSAVQVNKELLAALKGLRAVVHDFLTHNEQTDCQVYIEAADKAIAKAEGGAS